MKYKIVTVGKSVLLLLASNEMSRRQAKRQRNGNRPKTLQIDRGSRMAQKCQIEERKE